MKSVDKIQKQKKNEKGFTLIELLAVIVILAIILTVAVPAIVKVIYNTKQVAFEESAVLVKGTITKFLTGAKDASEQTSSVLDSPINSTVRVITSSEAAKLDLNEGTFAICGDPATCSTVKYENSEVVVKLEATDSGKFAGLDPVISPEDKTAPVITIIGDNPMVVPVGTLSAVYNPGATALDDMDGDLTSSIETTDLVNNAVEDDYTITYTVEDTAGNIATAERTVTIAAAPVITLNEGLNNDDEFLGQEIILATTDYTLEGSGTVTVTVDGTPVSLPHTTSSTIYGFVTIEVIYSVAGGNSVTRYIALDTAGGPAF